MEVLTQKKDKISKDKFKPYPLLKLDIDDIKRIYEIFKKYCTNVGCIIAFNDRAYQIDDINDFDINEKRLDFIEFIGYNPYVGLTMSKPRVRLFLSDSSDKNLLALERDLDLLFSERNSKWNFFTNKSFIWVPITLTVLAFILVYENPTNSTSALLMMLILFAVPIWSLFKNYLEVNRHITVTVIKPKSQNGKINFGPLSLSYDLGELFKTIGDDLFLTICRFIVYGIIGTALFWIISQLLSIKIFP